MRLSRKKIKILQFLCFHFWLLPHPYQHWCGGLSEYWWICGHMTGCGCVFDSCRFLGNIVCSISSYAVDGLKGCLWRLFVSSRTLLVTPVQLLFGANIQTVNLMTESHCMLEKKYVLNYTPTSNLSIWMRKNCMWMCHGCCHTGCLFHNLLICWDFSTQPSLQFIENDVKKGENPVSFPRIYKIEKYFYLMSKNKKKKPKNP